MAAKRREILSFRIVLRFTLEPCIIIRIAVPGMDRGQHPHLLRFGIFELDLSAQELRRAGALLKVQSQHFQLLALLVERAGRVVTREEIRGALWGDQTFVDFDRGINFCINQIRASLDDDPRNPRYIETLPRKGYRFIAPVAAPELPDSGFGPGKEDAPSPMKASGRALVPGPILRQRRLWVLATVAGTVLLALSVFVLRARRLPSKPVQSLAVLPLDNLSNDPEQEYFADGMTDELITSLAKIGALRVVSRTSVMRYRGTKKPLPEIARELNVDAVIEGTVLRVRNRVRITAQLIRAAPEEHLWAEQYEGNMEDVLTLQDTVAKDVARSIKMNLTPRERTLLATPRPVDPAAHDAYLKGRYLWERPLEVNLVKSREYFEQAVQKDPSYALAWAGLASAYDRLADWGILATQDARPRERAAAEKAVQLDSSLAEALIALAEVKREYEWDWAAVERLCRQAIQISPNYGEAHHTYATYLAEVGRTREAVSEALRAREAEPLSLVYSANVVWKLYLDRRYREAELEDRKINEFYPGLTSGYSLASVYLQERRWKEALAELHMEVAAPHSGIIELAYLGHALGVTGARAEGEKVLQQMLLLSRRRNVPPDYIAMVYEGLGEREQALQWYEKACAERSINGWMLPDPQLDAIRAEPRFKEILRRMGLPSSKAGSGN